MSRGLSIVLAVVAIVAAGATAVWLGNRSIDARTPPAVASSPPPRPSELYASDGTTLIARFDSDPTARCLAITNSWGFYCQYLVDWWQQQLAFGADPAERLTRLRTGGYRVVGSLDIALQATALRQVESAAVGGRTTFSVSTVAPGTGLIRAMAVNQRLQPPSAAPGGTVELGDVAWLPTASGGAPFMIFTIVAALESGLPLDHTIDTKRQYQTHFRIAPQDPQACRSSGSIAYWCPVNAGDKRYLSGPRTTWEAFTHAVNTYFVALEESLGAAKVVDVAQRLGIRFKLPDKDLADKYASQWGAFTLGAAQVSALDLANAYATLAADGLRCEPQPVQAVTDARGRAVTGLGPQCTRVVTAEVARAAIDAGRCAVGDRSAAGDVCGPGAVAASGVRAAVGRPVTGQFGLNPAGTQSTLVVTSPGLSTAGLLAEPNPGPDGGPSGAQDAKRNAGVFVQAVSRVHHDGLAPLPESAFPPPPQTLVNGHS
jgi:membrane peptidoglycan carboxypeptidase